MNLPGWRNRWSHQTQWGGNKTGYLILQEGREGSRLPGWSNVCRLKWEKKMSSVSPLQKVSAVDWGCFLRRDDERSYSHSVELPGWAVACLTSEIFGDIWEKKALRKEGWWFGAGGVFFFFQQCRQVRLKHMRERREKDGGYLLQIKGRSTFLSFLNVARLDLESRWVSDWTQTQNASFFFCLECQCEHQPRVSGSLRRESVENWLLWR